MLNKEELEQIKELISDMKVSYHDEPIDIDANVVEIEIPPGCSGTPPGTGLGYSGDYSDMYDSDLEDSSWLDTDKGNKEEKNPSLKNKIDQLFDNENLTCFESPSETILFYYLKGCYDNFNRTIKEK